MLKSFLEWYNKSDSLVRDSFLFFSASMVLNLAGFFYHFYMGRVLGPTDYGVLGAMLSLLYILLVLFNVIQTSVAKFASKFSANKKFGKTAYLLKRGLRKLFALGVFGALLYALGGFFIPEFANIPYATYMILAFALPLIFLLPLSRGILQGVQNFRHLSLNLISEGIGKVFMGVFLVAIGLGVNGAMLGIVFSYVLAFGTTFISLKDVFKRKSEAFDTKEIYRYSVPVLVSMMILTLMYSIDVILVKHYFPEVEAGYYASASLLGKIVFFASLAISTVMFPKVIALNESKKPSKAILRKSIMLVCILIAGGLFFTVLFPKFVVMLFFGSEYLAITNILWVFCLVFSFFALSYLLSVYCLSMNRSSFNYILALFLIVEIIAIALFHESLEEVVFVLAGVMAALFLSLLIYTFKHNAKTELSNTGL